jgi:hypothetical protein
MSGDGIQYYAGEFLISPAGLELSMNWCGHDCAYCFANAMSPNRRADLTGIMGLLSRYQTGTSREARLLQAGVPLLVSNHVDPFAGTNAEQFEPIWEVLVEAGIPLTWQTRGAHKPQRRILDRVIRETPRSVWYISIPFLDEDVRRRVEPRAPSIGSRLDLVDQLIAAGHAVTVGVNPLCLEWLPDYEPLLDRLKAAGVWGIWAQAPYFSKSFKGNLRPDQVAALRPEFISQCGEGGSKIDIAHALQAMEYARSIGLETFSIGEDRPTRFFDPWHVLYKRVMPYWRQVINAADAILQEDGPDIDGKDYLILTLESALAALETLPPGIDWGKYAHRKCSREFRRAMACPGGPLPKLDADRFWRLVWNDDFFSRSMGPARLRPFAFAADIRDSVITPLLDDSGNKLVVYRPNGWATYYAHTPELS